MNDNDEVAFVVDDDDADGDGDYGDDDDDDDDDDGDDDGNLSNWVNQANWHQTKLNCILSSLKVKYFSLSSSC